MSSFNLGISSTIYYSIFLKTLEIRAVYYSNTIFKIPYRDQKRSTQTLLTAKTPTLRANLCLTIKNIRKFDINLIEISKCLSSKIWFSKSSKVCRNAVGRKHVWIISLWLIKIHYLKIFVLAVSFLDKDIGTCFMHFLTSILPEVER